MSIIFGKINSEIAPYTVISTLPDYEIRHYGPQLLATHTSTNGGNSFRALAGYCGIFTSAKQIVDDKKVDIPMTAPVYRQSGDGGKTAGDWLETMSFILPAKFKEVEDLPHPINQEVKLSKTVERTVAVITFNGNVSEDVYKAKSELLKSYCVRDKVQIKDDNYTLAGYNPPFAIPYFKRNEIFLNIIPEVKEVAPIV